MATRRTAAQAPASQTSAYRHGHDAVQRLIGLVQRCATEGVAALKVIEGRGNELMRVLEQST